MAITWLRHAALQARYSCSRNTIDRLVDESALPPKSFPANSAPMWPLELLDVWDVASPAEREIILMRWPDWRGVLTTIAAERAVAVKPQRRRRKQQKRKRAASTAISEATTNA